MKIAVRDESSGFNRSHLYTQRTATPYALNTYPKQQCGILPYWILNRFLNNRTDAVDIPNCNSDSFHKKVLTEEDARKNPKVEQAFVTSTIRQNISDQLHTGTGQNSLAP